MGLLQFAVAALSVGFGGGLGLVGAVAWRGGAGGRQVLGDGRGEGLEQAGGIEDEEDEAGLVNPGVAALYA